MQFSEKQLVDLFWHSHLWHQCPIGTRAKGRRTYRARTIKLTAFREYTLPSGKRMDLFVKDERGRANWIVEFKIVAQPDALIQLLQYQDEVVESMSTSIYAIGVVLAAQFFAPHTLYLAEKLNIPCLQLAPLNYESMTVSNANYWPYMSPSENIQYLRPLKVTSPNLKALL